MQNYFEDGLTLLSLACQIDPQARPTPRRPRAPAIHVGSQKSAREFKSLIALAPSARLCIWTVYRHLGDSMKPRSFQKPAAGPRQRLLLFSTWDLSKNGKDTRRRRKVFSKRQSNPDDAEALLKCQLSYSWQTIRRSRGYFSRYVQSAAILGLGLPSSRWSRSNAPDAAGRRPEVFQTCPRNASTGLSYQISRLPDNRATLTPANDTGST